MRLQPPIQAPRVPEVSNERRPPTTEEVERMQRLQAEATWSIEDATWWMEMDKVIVWDITPTSPPK